MLLNLTCFRLRIAISEYFSKISSSNWCLWVNCALSNPSPLNSKFYFFRFTPIWYFSSTWVTWTKPIGEQISSFSTTFSFTDFRLKTEEKLI